MAMIWVNGTEEQSVFAREATLGSARPEASARSAARRWSIRRVLGWRVVGRSLPSRWV